MIIIKVNMVLSGGLFYRSPIFMKKENDRKIDIDSFDESSSGMKGGKCVMAHQDKENEIEAAGRKLQIRNSTVDFLVFTKDAGEDGIEVRVLSRELLEESTCANFAQVADNGKTYQYKFYSLSALLR